MEILYYPDMYINSEEALKHLILSWGNVRTVVPPSEMERIKSYTHGEVNNWVHFPLEIYKKVWDAGGKDILDFLVISDKERKQASERMFDLICNWNKDTRFYESLKIHTLGNLGGKVVTWYWFLNEKLEKDLVELLLEERLVYPLAPGEITGYEEVGKSYMSIIVEEIKRNRNVRLITDDEFSVAAKSGVGLVRAKSQKEVEEGYQLVSMAIPQVFIEPKVLKNLAWDKVMKIRQDLLPLAENYYQEVESYQEKINSLGMEGKDKEAFDKFCEFCERVSKSFKPLSKETGKIFRLGKSMKAIGFINGFVLPTIKLLISQAELSKVCDIVAVSLAASNYMLSMKKPLLGFDYLESLNRKLNIERMKNAITCLIPKGVKE